MKEWLLSLVGIAFLGVLVDILTPNKNLNKFIKSIFAIFFLFVIISPIAKFKPNQVFFKPDTGVNMDENFLQKNILMRITTIENSINSHLKKNNINGVNVTLAVTLLDFDFVVNEVEVNTQNIVLTKDLNHKNKYEKIINLICETTNFKKEIIKFYE